MRKLLTTVAGLALLAGTTLVVSAAEVPATASAQTSTLRTELNQRCADVWGWINSNGSAVVTWDCHSGANQQWFWDGEFLRNNMAGRCLEVYNGERGSGAPVNLWDCNGGDHQRWITDNGRIVNKASGKCLDIIDGNQQNGQLLRVWDCHNGPSQQWRM
ncbi:hypothetical protein D5S17_01270 [Pseudonocardiaceae bacterium YIM PH 21723]|nr:hypothetical protein D5S17_01270 [Pseudonocardiaceae bacterium YIM PH 21723]